MENIRLNKISAEMDKSGIDTLVLNPGASLYYLTGLEFHLSERPIVFILVRPNRCGIVLPELEQGKLLSSKFPIKTYSYSDDPDYWSEAFQKATTDMGISGTTIGIEPSRLRVMEYRFLENSINHSLFVSAETEISKCRAVKDDTEIQAMRIATDIAERSLLQILPEIREGRTEKEIAARLVCKLLENGSDTALPFQPIVISGTNSSNPHGTPSDRILQFGDFVIIDWGAAFNGYCSDITRTFVIGQATEEQKFLYQKVLEANQAGREISAPGIMSKQVDDACRNVLRKYNLDNYFIHRTGHGLGLEPHETPYIHANNPVFLQPGMVYTIEPGIYLPGKGGIRIEDDILITDEGSISLTTLPRELMILK